MGADLLVRVGDSARTAGRHGPARGPASATDRVVADPRRRPGRAPSPVGAETGVRTLTPFRAADLRPWDRSQRPAAPALARASRLAGGRGCRTRPARGGQAR